jgi:hypothetical protein
MCGAWLDVGVRCWRSEGARGDARSSPQSLTCSGRSIERYCRCAFAPRENTRRQLADNKTSARPPKIGLNKRLNRRFRKQSGGLLIRGSDVRILPGALGTTPDLRVSPRSLARVVAKVVTGGGTEWITLSLHCLAELRLRLQSRDLQRLITHFSAGEC